MVTIVGAKYNLENEKKTPLRAKRKKHRSGCKRMRTKGIERKGWATKVLGCERNYKHGGGERSVQH